MVSHSATAVRDTTVNCPSHPHSHMSSIEIRRISPKSSEKILSFINEHFCNVRFLFPRFLLEFPFSVTSFPDIQAEPMSESMGGLYDSPSSDFEVRELAKCGFSFEAVDTEAKENAEPVLAGVLLCTTHKEGEPHPVYDEMAKIPIDEKFQRILDITDYAKVLAKPVIKGQHGLLEYQEGVILSVSQSYSGRGIAKRLVEAMEHNALERGIKLIYVGCSSEFTAKVLTKMDYQNVLSIPYAEYEKDGKVLFPSVKAPHVAYKGFIKLLGKK